MLRRRSFSLALALLAVLPAAGEEITDSYPDGTPKARYTVDSQARLNGCYTAFHPNGKPAVRCHYKGGVREGSYQDFHLNGYTRVEASFRAGLLEGSFRSLAPDGDILAKAHYRKGVLDGKCILYRQGKPSDTQVWKDGALQSLEGVPAYPRPLAGLLEQLKAILGSQEASATTEEAGLKALRKLQAYRFLCEVPHEGMSLDLKYCHGAEAAADICRRNGELSHEPPNPGLPAAAYCIALNGAKHCNLAGGKGIGSAGMDIVSESVKGYMDDSDPSNIDCVGHRRWCLNPAMLKTGFGSSGNYSAMWSLDHGRGKLPDYDVVAFPPKGYVPVGYFASHYAWSLSLNPARYEVPQPGSVQVQVFPLDEHYRRAPEPLPMDAFNLSTDGPGSGPCIIFKPKGIEVAPGRRYWVEVKGLGRKPTLKYLVAFVGPDGEQPEAATPEAGAEETVQLPLLPPLRMTPDHPP